MPSTPPLGFNRYDSYRSRLTEDKAYALMDVMAEKYLSFGYEYFVMDAGWYSTMDPEKNENSKLETFGVNIVNDAYFPNGTMIPIESKAEKFESMEGVIKVPSGSGLGVRIDPDYIKTHKTVKV